MPESEPWRRKTRDLAAQFPHPSWGPSHCERVYSLSRELADASGEAVDDDVLFALAYLHDLGAFAPFSERASTAAEASALVAEDFLPGSGFPKEKTSLVLRLLRGHDWERDPGPRPEARYFRDADMLDFMGAVGVARLLAIVGVEDWTPEVSDAVQVIRDFAGTIPRRLITPAARRVAERRELEMRDFVGGLSLQTYGLQSL